MSGAVSTQTFELRLDMALRAKWSWELRSLLADLPTALGSLRRARSQADEEALAPTPLTLAGDAPVLVLGRHRTCDHQFDDDTVSRRHAVIRRTATGLTVQDLESTNGSWLNGVRFADETAIADGDELCLGGMLLVIHLR